MMKAFVDELLKIKLARRSFLPKAQTIAERKAPQFVSAKSLPAGKPVGMRGGPPKMPPGRAGKLTGRVGKGIARGAKALLLKR